MESDPAESTVEEYCSNCQRNVAVKNYLIHSAHCQRNIQLCHLCNEPFPIKEIKQHMDDYHIVKSCEACDKRMEKWQLEKHKNLCRKRRAACQFCELSHAYDELAEHEDYCGSRTQACNICKQFVMMKDQKVHKEICKEVPYDRKPFFSEPAYSLSTIRDSFRNNSQVAINEYGRRKDESRSCIAACSADAKNDKEAWQGKFFKKERKGLKDDEMKALIEKTKEVFVTCYICNKGVLKSEMEEHSYNCAARNSPVDEEQNFPEDYMTKVHMADDSKPPPYTEVVESICSGLQYENRKTLHDMSKSHPETDEEECPICLSRVPSMVYNGHVEYCSQREIICHFCKLEILFLDLESHLQSCKMAKKTSVKEETSYSPYHEESFKDRNQMLDICAPPSYADIVDDAEYENDEMMRQISSPLSLEISKEKCPICLSQIPSTRFSYHTKYCSERKTICHFCNTDILILDQEDHLRKCEMAKRIPSNSEKEYASYESRPSTFSNVLKKSVNLIESIWGEVEKDTYVPSEPKSKCSICNMMIIRSEESDHFDECLKKSSVCNFCGDNVLIPNFKQHIDNECKKAEKNNWETVERGGCRGKKKPMPRNYSKYFTKGGNSIVTKPEKVEPVMLPCEFCEKLFSEDYIIQHQSGCRPDIVSYTNKSEKEELYEDPNLKLFSAAPEIPVRKHRKSKYSCDSGASPGEYLQSSAFSSDGKTEAMGRNTFHMSSSLDDHLSSIHSKSELDKNNIPNSFNQKFSEDTSKLKNTFRKKLHLNNNCSKEEIYLKYLNNVPDDEPSDSKTASWSSKSEVGEKSKMSVADKLLKAPFPENLRLKTQLSRTNSATEEKNYDNKFAEAFCGKNNEHEMLEEIKPKTFNNLIRQKSSEKSAADQRCHEKDCSCHGNGSSTRTKCLSEEADKKNLYWHKKEYKDK